MSKIKLTKGELKRQRDSLRQYERYLPTLQLKKQQLQLQILQELARLEEKEHQLSLKKKTAESWIDLLNELDFDLRQQLKVREMITTTKNVAGVDFAVFSRLEFIPAEYDLFLTPLWLDNALEQLRAMISLQEEIETLGKGIAILRSELRITTQRVNLFEKVKIPEATEAIRLIKVYLGDQMTNAVGRSKIAKQKIEEFAELSLAA